jgi:protoporphyrinogen oxidase
LIKLIRQSPQDVIEAAARLAWTSVAIVNLGINRADVSSAHWSYFYDEDIVFSRLSYPHMQSPHTVPSGCGSIQAEIYFSEKYRPMPDTPQSYIPRVIADLKRCGLLTEFDQVLFSEATVSPFAQVIFDLERASALEIVRGYLNDVGIATCGRYGDWGYLWTDEAFISGERAAEETLKRLLTSSVSKPSQQPAAA